MVGKAKTELHPWTRNLITEYLDAIACTDVQTNAIVNNKANADVYYGISYVIGDSSKTFKGNVQEYREQAERSLISFIENNAGNTYQSQYEQLGRINEALRATKAGEHISWAMGQPQELPPGEVAIPQPVVGEPKLQPGMEGVLNNYTNNLTRRELANIMHASAPAELTSILGPASSDAEIRNEVINNLRSYLPENGGNTYEGQLNALKRVNNHTLGDNRYSPISINPTGLPVVLQQQVSPASVPATPANGKQENKTMVKPDNMPEEHWKGYMKAIETGDKYYQRIIEHDYDLRGKGSSVEGERNNNLSLQDAPDAHLMGNRAPTGKPAADIERSV